MAERLQSSEQAQQPGTEVKSIPQPVVDKMKATFFGQCIGDALGLLTEFMTKDEAKTYYGKKPKTLRYEQKVPDFHRGRWEVGDWTDDTDQMILILQSLLYNRGEVVTTDFAKRMKRWMRRGFPELGDIGGMGIGGTTSKVLGHPEYLTDPEKAAYVVWEANQRNIAPNGCVMRTSILGMHQWNDIEKVFENALRFGKSSHVDPRCQASVVAVTTCIAKMLQHAAAQQNSIEKSSKKLPLDDIIKQSYDMACRVLETDAQKTELWKHMSSKKLKDLALCETGKIGYTYKCMGCGFWAVKQDNFEKAMVKLVMEAGDADTNGAVAGAMLACKLGLEAIPDHWISGLLHKDMILNLYNRFLKLQTEMSIPLEERTSNDDLSIANLNALGDKYLEEQKEKQQQEEMKNQDK